MTSSFTQVLTDQNPQNTDSGQVETQTAAFVEALQRQPLTHFLPHKRKKQLRGGLNEIVANTGVLETRFKHLRDELPSQA